MYPEDDLLPISALQHLIFCQRQCALIHVEGLWAENRLTVEGRQLHDKAHEAGNETRHDVRIARALPLVSYRLGLTGVADVVEFHFPPGADPPAFPMPISEPSDQPRVAPGTFRQVIPVEYKRGRPKRDHSDRVQLAAQALALEEMLGVAIEQAALFYGRTRRRLDVALDPPLRRLTVDTADRLHELIQSGHTPPAELQPKCKRCSLRNLCLPHAGKRASVARWFDRTLSQMRVAPPFDEIDE